MTDYHELADDQLLRREAGEGWHESNVGSQVRLLSELITREAIVSELVATGRDKGELTETYHEQCERVNGLKKELGIGDPPPTLPPEE